MEGIGGLGMGEGTEGGCVAIEETREAAFAKRESLDSQVGLNLLWRTEATQETGACEARKEISFRNGGRIKSGPEVLEAQGVVTPEHHQKAVAAKAGKHRTQLEQKTGAARIEDVEAAIVAAYPGITLRRSGLNTLLVDAGRGLKWQVFISRGGLLQLQHGGGRCQRPSSIDDLVSRIQPDEVDAASNVVSAANLYQLLEQKQNFRCAMTGRELTPENVELDHIAPRSSEGKHDIHNVHLVVRDVNRAKGSMDMEEFIRLCNDVARTHPRG